MQEKTTRILSIALFFSLLIWGTYVTLTYIGVPVHGLVLLAGGAEERLQAACGNGFLCRGLYGFFPLISHTLARMSAFLPYLIASLVFYGLFFGWRFLRSGSLPREIRFRPWHVVALFVVSLWMIFTSIALDKTGGDFPIRRIIEPLPQVYVNVGEEGMQELKANFDRLQANDCLTYIAHTNNNAAVYDMKLSCMNGAFISRVLTQLLFILFIVFELLILGRFALRLLKVKPESILLESALSAGAGACLWVSALWLLAVAHIFVASAGWALLILLPVLLHRHTLYWGRRFLFHTWTVPFRWYGVSVILGWLLLSYFALNFLNVVRPFPIGWDDLGSYLNRPKLLVSYGRFVFSMAPFQWEYLTALGFLLFGYESIFGGTAAMLINWMAGFLAVLTIFAFANTYLGRGHGLLSSLLYYTLPLVGHFSYADMKIDNAVFMMGTLSLFSVFLYLFPEKNGGKGESDASDIRWLVLAGAFGGFAMAMKPTAAMVVAAAGAVLFGAGLHWSAFLGAITLVFFVFWYKGVLNLRGIWERLFGSGGNTFRIVFLVVAFVCGFTTLVYASLQDRSAFRRILQGTGLVIAGFLVSIAPWIIHNNILRGNIIPRFEMGAPNTLSPTIVLSGGKESAEDFGQDIRVLPPELALDITHPTCTPSGTREELDRYWGFGHGWKHYVTLPWRIVMNLDATGYYVTTMPALLLFPLLLLLPYFWTKRGRWLRWLFAGTLFILLEWMFMANGIPWYGIGMFFGFVIGLETLHARAPDTLNKVLVSIFIAVSLVVTFANRFWQFEQQRNLFEYAIGKISASALRERTIPHYDDIAQVAVNRHLSIPDRPYLYRVGTFIPYFIPKNLEMIGLADHQLDTFNCFFQERDPELTLKRLQAFGFNSILFDTNTATIEQDMNGTLHQKVQALVSFLNNTSLGLQVIVNDPDAGVAFILIP
ncbi:MAG: glycosyltransferase family 39 protein [Patescibacteria group bacterium]